VGTLRLSTATRELRGRLTYLQRLEASQAPFSGQRRLISNGFVRSVELSIMSPGVPRLV